MSGIYFASGLARYRDSDRNLSSLSLRSVLMIDFLPWWVGLFSSSLFSVILPTSVERPFLFLKSCSKNPGIGSDWPSMDHVPIFEPITVAGGSGIHIRQSWVMCPSLNQLLWLGEMVLSLVRHGVCADPKARGRVSPMD